MDISYVKDGNRNKMIIKGLEINENDYKLQMAMNNRIDGILEFRIEHLNNDKMVYYDISSKIKFENLYTRKRMSGKELYSFIKDIKILAENLDKYLLNLNNILFDLAHIYFNKQTGKYEFCYIPQSQGDFEIRLRDLLDNILDYIDHNDKEAVLIAYGMQQITTNADFTLQDLLRCAYENMQTNKKNSNENNGNQGKTKEYVKLDDSCTGKQTTIEKNISGKKHKDKSYKERNNKERKKGLVSGITSFFKKKEKYKTEKQLEYDELFEEERVCVAEDETYNENQYGYNGNKNYNDNNNYIDRNYEGEVYFNDKYDDSQVNDDQEDDDKTTLLVPPENIVKFQLEAMDSAIPIIIKPLDFPYVIGKSKCSCNFCIDSAVISRVHMRIVEEWEDYYIEDLSSTNGTYLNGEKLQPHQPQQINIGDKIRLANLEFMVEEPN